MEFTKGNDGTGSEILSAYCLIDRRYLLVTFIPSYVDDENRIWVDALWHHDLIEHFQYLKDFTLASPVQRYAKAPNNVVVLSPPPDVRFKLFALPHTATLGQSLLNVPVLVARLWRAVSHAEVVHSGIAGWPIPLGWIANALALVRRRPLVLVVESAPWRISDMTKVTLRRRVRSALTEFLGRFFMRRATLAIATQPGYLNTLRGAGSRGRELLAPATWINDDDIISRDQLLRKLGSNKGRGHLRLLFAGRLASEKGVEVLLRALVALDDKGVELSCDLVGAGPLGIDCRRFVGKQKSVRICILDPVPYGSRFFQLMTEYDCLVLPTLTDEQPRVILDAFSQGLPVLATETDGNSSLVRPQVNGWLVPVGDHVALAEALLYINGNRGEVARKSKGALSSAYGWTHVRMHQHRSRVLMDSLTRYEKGIDSEPHG